MDTILLFKKDLETYPTDSLRVLHRYLGLPAASRKDLVWLLAIHQAQNNHKKALMNGSASEGKEEADLPPIEPIEPIQSFGDDVKIAVFNPDGSLVATASAGGAIEIWDVQSGELAHTLQSDGVNVRNIDFNDDSTQVVTASDDRTAKIWDVDSGDLVHTLDHRAPVLNATFNHDGSQVVTASIDVKIWNVQTGTVVWTFEGHRAVIRPVFNAVFNHDGTLVVSDAGGNAKIWNVDSGELVHTLDHSGHVDNAVFNNAGTLVVTASQNGKVTIWDVKTGDLQTLKLDDLFGSIPNRIRRAAFNDDSSLVVITSQDDKVRIWDVETDEVRILGDNIHTAALNHDGSLIVTTTTQDNTATIWDIQTGEVVQILEGHSGDWVHNAVFNRSGSLVVAISGTTHRSSKNTAMVWPTGFGRMIKAARPRGTMKGAAQPSEGTAQSGKPTVYLVAGAPGAGKSTSIEHLIKSGIIPKDVVDIDRDLITENNIDFDQKLQEIHTAHGYDSEVEEFEIYKMMTDAFRSTKPLYKDAIMFAVDKQQDFVTYIPPFTIKEVPEGYNIVLIFIDTDPDVAYERTLLRAQGKKWLKLNTVDVYCSWNKAIETVEKYCLTGKCYICDNRGEEIKCLNFEEYPRKLPTADQAVEMCEVEKQQVRHQQEQVLEKIARKTKHDVASPGYDEDISTPLSGGYVDISTPLSEGYVDISSTSSAVDEAGYFD